MADNKNKKVSRTLNKTAGGKHRPARNATASADRRESLLLEAVRHAPLKSRVGVTCPTTNFRRTGELGRMAREVTQSSNLLTGASDGSMYKTVNIELTAGSVSYNGLLFSLLGSIVQGDQDGQRVGDMIDIRHLSFRWEATYGTVNTAACRTGFRVVVFRSAIPNLGVSDILRTIGSAYAAVSPINEDFIRASEVLYDSLVNMDEYHPYHVGHAERKLSMPVLYEGNIGLAFGNLYVLMISGEDPAQTTYVPAGFGYVQIKYVDV